MPTRDDVLAALNLALIGAGKGKWTPGDDKRKAVNACVRWTGGLSPMLEAWDQGGTGVAVAMWGGGAPDCGPAMLRPEIASILKACEPGEVTLDTREGGGVSLKAGRFSASLIGPLLESFDDPPEAWDLVWSGPAAQLLAGLKRAVRWTDRDRTRALDGVRINSADGLVASNGQGLYVEDLPDGDAGDTSADAFVTRKGVQALGKALRLFPGECELATVLVGEGGATAIHCGPVTVYGRPASCSGMTAADIVNKGVAFLRGSGEPLVAGEADPSTLAAAARRCKVADRGQYGAVTLKARGGLLVCESDGEEGVGVTAPVEGGTADGDGEGRIAVRYLDSLAKSCKGAGRMRLTVMPMGLLAEAGGRIVGIAGMREAKPEAKATAAA